MTRRVWLVLTIAAAGAIGWMASSMHRPGANVAEEGHSSGAGARLYWTTPGLESDTCVAAWLLTRYVSPGARVELRNMSEEGVAFDVPGCTLQRQPGMAVSDIILSKYDIQDPFARNVVAVVHEIELNPWTTRDDRFFMTVRSGLAEAINLRGGDEHCLAEALRFLDELRLSLSASSE